MTPEEIAELKRLAEASQAVNPVAEWYSLESCEDFDVLPVDAVFIATVTPKTILSLIAHAEDLQARIDRALVVANDPGARSSVALSAVRELLSGLDEEHSNE